MSSESRPSPYLDLESASRYLGLKPRTLRQAVYERRVAFFRVGRLLRFKLEDLDAYAARSEAEPWPVRGGAR